MAKRAGEDPEVLHRRAQIAVLTGMAAGEQDAYELMAAVMPYDVRFHFTPDVAMLELAASALDLAVPPGTPSLVYEGLRKRYLPEVTLRTRTEHHHTQYAIYAAACMRGGLDPNLLDDAGGWQPRLWTYAVFALLIYSRAAADRLGEPLDRVAVRLAEQHHVDLPGGGQPSSE